MLRLLTIQGWVKMHQVYSFIIIEQEWCINTLRVAPRLMSQTMFTNEEKVNPHIM